MKRSYGVTAVMAVSLLLVPVHVAAQGSADEASPWEVGAGIGISVNEPAVFFKDCGPSRTVGRISLRGSYSVEPWLKTSLLGAGHLELYSDGCFTLPRYSTPGTYTSRVYPDRISGSASYFATAARAAIDPLSSGTAIRPVLIVGLGRIWGKQLTYPTIGLGASVPVGELTIRVEALGRRLSVPYDSVTTRVSQEFEVSELSRIRRSEEHLPLLFRLGVAWRP